MKRIPESDWKKLRSMKSDVLNFVCKRIFEEIDKISSEREGKEHKAYLKLWKLLNLEDRQIAFMFDDLKRSNAILKLAAWKRNGVISNENFSKFSDETRQIIEALNKALH